MSNNKEVDKWLWSLGIGGVAAVVFLGALSHRDEQGRLNIVVNTKHGCLVNGPAANYWEECPPLHPPAVMAVTPELQQQQPAQAQPEQRSNSQESVSTDPIRAAIEAKNIGDQFEVIDQWDNHYLVEKTGRERLEVISVLSEPTFSSRGAKIVPIRYVKEVR